MSKIIKDRYKFSRNSSLVKSARRCAEEWNEIVLIGLYQETIHCAASDCCFVRRPGYKSDGTARPFVVLATYNPETGLEYINIGGETAEGHEP